MEINIKHMFGLCLIIALFLLFVKPVMQILNIYPAAPDTRATTRKQKQSTMCFWIRREAPPSLAGTAAIARSPTDCGVAGHGLGTQKHRQAAPAAGGDRFFAFKL